MTKVNRSRIRALNRTIRQKTRMIAVTPSVPESQGGIGQVIDAPEAGDDMPSIEEQARDWEIAVNQAATVAQQAGKAPAGLKRTLEGAAEAQVDWRELLRRLWSDTIPADSSWMRPNRRHIWSGLYLPGVVREGTAKSRSPSIARDRSMRGSCGSSRRRSVRSSKASGRSGCMFSTSTPRFTRSIPTWPVRCSISNPVGGGGTDFGPCFDWLNEHGIHPQTMVFLTDLYGSFPESAPDYPVLWASTGSRQAPFGSVIPMHAA
jgi:hypothetical protein